MTESIAPENYREIPFEINGQPLLIAGMAKLDWRGHNLDESIEFLKESQVTRVISLQYEKPYQMAADKRDIQYINQHIADFQPPTIQQCNEIYEIARECALNGEKMAIHCTAGRGRTGTVLAALKLKQLIENNPEPPIQQTKSSVIKMGSYGGNEYVLCTPLVRMAVDEIRGIKDSEDSVEVAAQIKMLCEYQHWLIEKKLNQATPYKSEFIPKDHSAVLAAQKIILLLKTELNSQPNLNVGAINKVINSLEKDIKNLVSKKDDNYFATAAINQLITNIISVDNELLTDTKNELIELKTDFFCENKNTSMTFTDTAKALLSSKLIPIYIYLSQLLKKLNEPSKDETLEAPNWNILSYLFDNLFKSKTVNSFSDNVQKHPETIIAQSEETIPDNTPLAESPQTNIHMTQLPNNHLSDKSGKNIQTKQENQTEKEVTSNVAKQQGSKAEMLKLRSQHNTLTPTEIKRDAPTAPFSVHNK